MKNKQYKYTYGKPGLTSALLAVYLLVWVGTFVFTAIANGSSECSQLALIAPYLLLLASNAILLVVSIVLAVRYTNRIRYLKARKLKVPKLYGLTLALLPFALMMFFWVVPLTDFTEKWSADTKMNTIEDFQALVLNCSVGSIGFFYNDYHHRDSGSNAYIKVYNASDRLDYHFYSYNQKDAIRQTIGNDYPDRCPLQTNYGRGTFGGLYEYSESDWTEGIKKYGGGC